MIFIISDIHARLPRLERQIRDMEKSAGRKMSSDDVIIILGDLFYTNPSKLMRFTTFPRPSLKTDLSTIGLLSMLPCKVLIIRGNHESDAKLQSLGLIKGMHFGGNTYDYTDSVFFCGNGEKYAIESNGMTSTFLALGGAYGHGLPFANRGQEAIDPHMAMTCEMIAGEKADYVIAHDAPSSAVHPHMRAIFGCTSINNAFEAFKDKIEFGSWLYGHHHIDYDAGAFHCIYNRILCIDGRELKALER